MIPVQEVVYRIGVYGQNLRYYKLTVKKGNFENKIMNKKKIFFSKK